MTSPSRRTIAPRVSSLAAIVAACVALLISRPAVAEDAVDLSWDAPPGCPRVGAVRERLRALRGTRSRVSGRLRAEGRIVRVDGRYRLILGVHEGNAVLERKIDAESCKDLAGAAAVALALLLRDDEVSREPAGTSSNAAEPRATAAEPNNVGEAAASESHDASPTSDESARSRGEQSERSATPNPSERPEVKAPETPRTPGALTASESKRSWRVLVRPLATLDVGPLPRPAGTFGLALGWSSDEWRLLIVGRNTVGQSMTSSAQPDAKADIRRMTLELWACRSWRRGIVEGGPCLALAGERTAASASGLGVTATDASVLGFGLGPGAGGLIHVTRWLALGANANLLLETSRPHVALAGLGEVGKLGPVSLSLSIGAELAF